MHNTKKGSVPEKKVKQKLSISIPLSKEEIDEDITALTGSRPAKKHRKRPKNTQKQDESLFPGSGLVSITPDSYKVPANYYTKL